MFQRRNIHVPALEHESSSAGTSVFQRGNITPQPLLAAWRLNIMFLESYKFWFCTRGYLFKYLTYLCLLLRRYNHIATAHSPYLRKAKSVLQPLMNLRNANAYHEQSVSTSIHNTSGIANSRQLAQWVEDLSRLEIRIPRLSPVGRYAKACNSHAVGTGAYSNCIYPLLFKI